ncbi:MAG: polyphosphate kinase 1 [Saprospiraceae bacterium]|nr:polyphosphate kinase 1 [Saprospiraceae bacterium]
MMNTKSDRYKNRDISWLSFNYRVLQEAKDTSVPLFERIKFLAIYSSNLDEFFKVRVAQLNNLLSINKKTKEELEFDPKKLHTDLLKIVNRQILEFNQIFDESIIPELKKYRIHLLRRLDLNAKQRKFVEDFFHDKLLPFVQPVLMVKQKIRPFLNNAALYLTIEMKDKEIVTGPNPTQFALIKIPSDHLPRFISLPPSMEGRHELIMLDDIIRHSVSFLFPGYHILDTYSIKLTRDAELYIDDEFKGNLIEKIKASIAKRNVGPTSRFVYDREMPEKLLNFLKSTFDIKKENLIPEGRYHNNFDFFKFPDFGLLDLKFRPLVPLAYKALENSDDFFKTISQKDHLIHFPYNTYESVVKFFEVASKDPNVTHIKIVQYRVAKKSRIMQSLIEAVKSGKHVSVFVEVKARFDEEANLKWGEKLKDAGVDVQYSLPGIKVHSKLALIRRIEDNEPKFYTYLSTGNFHEETAKIYCDMGLFTSDTRITDEVSMIFNFLETQNKSNKEFKHLLVGQFNLNDRLIELIDFEIKMAKNNKKAKIILKMNSLQDTEMIDKLYEASNAGVEIKLIIRGINCLITQKKNLSENIEAISIVDRFLEHARVFIFHHGGEDKVYLSSADWMVRNLHHRIETTFPIYDKEIKNEILDYINLQLSDNVKARILDEDSKNLYKVNGKNISIQSQIEIYYYLKRKSEA